jgi:hypothetical protein
MSNILWKDMPDGSIIVRLADYDSMVQIPDHVSLNSVDMSTMTVMYASPFHVSAQIFERNYSYLKSESTLIPPDIDARTLYTSWDPLIATHAEKRQSGENNWRCDLLNLLVSKSDLYSLGMVIAAFGFNRTTTLSRKAVNKLSGFVRDLITVGKMPMGSFDPRTETPTQVGANNQHVEGSRRSSSIMTISDATIQLSKIRKSFTAEELGAPSFAH